MGNNWAISIGINQYNNLQVLNFAKRDAEAMAAWFREEAKFDEVFLFTEDSPPIPANTPIPTEPTYGQLQRFLQAQFEKPLLKPGDNLWFFFAGHGIRHADKDYLMLADSNPGDVISTAISVEYITRRLRRCGADNVVLFLDACRDQHGRNGLGIREETHQGVITFYSCTANEKSWEIPELQHGSFTYTLLEGLRLHGEANCATVERLNEYLKSSVPQLNTRYRREIQNPCFKAEPPYKMYYILLEQSATMRDVEPLKLEASLSENSGNFELARQIWIRVLGVSRADLDAVSALERIAIKNSNLTRENNNLIRENNNLEGEVYKIKQKYLIRRRQFLIYLGSAYLGGIATKPLIDVVLKTNIFTEKLGNNITLEMVQIPSGFFMMGSPDTEQNRQSYESPQHQVNVPAFSIGKFVVTQEQYQQIMGNNPSYFTEKGAKRPVEQVSWNNAVEFCQKLSEKTGREYRLPSEAEWEYACRAGTTTPFHFGETITTELANYNGTSIYASEPKGKHLQRTTDVGIFPPNAFGLYDMHGNVWEWCQDDWHNNYIDAPKDGSVWTSRSGNYKLLRGGSWYYNPGFCRSAYRYHDDLVDLSDDIGFRVVCSGAAWT
jgi:formylglycine-generating enzyme required for sulfatase activity